MNTPHAPLILDIAGTQLSQTDRRRLAHPLTGGVILFGRNWVNRVQLTALCEAIKDVRPDALICVDHEGGRVQRFRTDGFTHLPPMRRLGEMWMQAVPRQAPAATAALQACKAATACGFVLGAELRACGVDMSFTPVLDLDHGESGVIGDRAFHRDPQIVSVLAQHLMHGLLQSGMTNCGKHFPGHGFVRADSHTEVPVDGRSLKTILADDAKPYEWLPLSLTSIMPAHVIYPDVDALPAGFSARWLQDILRRQLGFQGAIFSDDLSMEGARHIGGKTVSYTDAALVALQAGCDMVLLCNQSTPSSEGGGQAVDDLLDGLWQARQQQRWQASDASEWRRRCLLPSSPALDWSELMTDPHYMAALDALP